MKKAFSVATTGVLLALTTAMAAGCGESAAVADATPVMESLSGEKTENKDQNQTASDNNAQTETASDNNEKVETTAQGTNGSDLYEDFKKGNAKVKYTGKGDRSSYLQTSAALEVGKSYTMEEIAKAIESSNEYEEMKLTSNVEYTTIDCGKDGVPELLAEAPFGDEFRLLMIIKEIDGELVMCYDQDTWSRSYVEVRPDGVIEGSGSNGAAAHVVEYSYVDASGEYRFYYGLEETYTLFGDFYAYKGKDMVTLSTEGLDADHLGVRDYYFEADYEKREHYYEYFVIDDNFEDVTTEADYDDSNEFKKKFSAEGIKTYTKAEMEKMLKDRAAEIGYPE